MSSLRRGASTNRMDLLQISTFDPYEFRDSNQTNAAKFSLVEQLVLLPVFLGLSCGTVFGNALVIATLMLVRRLREPCNLLLVSLAASDLLIGLTVLPFEACVRAYLYILMNHK